MILILLSYRFMHYIVLTVASDRQCSLCDHCQTRTGHFRLHPRNVKLESITSPKWWVQCGCMRNSLHRCSGSRQADCQAAHIGKLWCPCQHYKQSPSYESHYVMSLWSCFGCLFPCFWVQHTTYFEYQHYQGSSWAQVPSQLNEWLKQSLVNCHGKVQYFPFGDCS